MSLVGFTFRGGIDLNHTIDETAPVLTSPAGTETGATTASLSVSTDEPNGDVYWVVTQSSTTPSQTQIKAGQDHTGSAAEDAGAITVTAVGAQYDNATGLPVNTTCYAHFMHEDSSGNKSTAVSSTSFTTDDDQTAPTLSSPSAAETGDTTASLSVSTDEANGTLYWVVTQSATSPSAAQVKAGQDHTGSAADDSGSQAVTATGTQNAGASGLAEQTTYYAHLMHEDAATNQSSVASSSSFTTEETPDTTPPVLTSPTGTATGMTTADLSVTTDKATGTIYWVVTQSATAPTKTQVKAGQDHAGSAAEDSGSIAVSSTGAKTDSATGLPSATTHYAHFMHEDAASNQSAVATSGSFMTNGSQPTIGAITAKVTDSNVITNDAFSHTQTAGNKLLVITASLVRDSTNQDPTITYNGASADTEGNYHNSTPSWNKPQIGYALFDSPASGANTVSVSWSGDVRRTTTYAIDLNYAGSLAATADNGGVWGTSVNHNINVDSAESLLILAAAAADCTVFSGLTATGMTTERYDETNGTDNTGLCLGLAYEIDPDTGTRGIVASFTNTGSDWVHGASFVISPNA